MNSHNAEMPMVDTRTVFHALQVLLALSNVELSDRQIAEITKIDHRHLHPILIDFERAGWLWTRWEGEPDQTCRPRRLYCLSYAGQKQARDAIASLKTDRRFRDQFADFIAWRRRSIDVAKRRRHTKVDVLDFAC